MHPAIVTVVEGEVGWGDSGVVGVLSCDLAILTVPPAPAVCPLRLAESWTEAPTRIELDESVVASVVGTLPTATVSLVQRLLEPWLLGSAEHTSELQSHSPFVYRLLPDKETTPPSTLTT